MGERPRPKSGRQALDFHDFRGRNKNSWCVVWHPMDERRTLQLMGWSMGGIVAVMFALNAFALASH
jgi:hypothetical protein